MQSDKKIRYAVTGLGHIAQVAVLPAFKHASDKCELTAFISNDKEKIEKLSEEYKVKYSWTYDSYDEALRSGQFDAVYIALPNDMHKEYTVRAARAGIHVLCEKPMATTVSECEEMIGASERHNVKLMIAYRLHFEPTNMRAVELIKAGKIGDARIFNSTFSLQVREGNIRTQSEHGGGPLNDIGIYCINASRYLFRQEPLEVSAMATRSSDPRFSEIEESVSAILKFPGEKLASFVCSFGATDMHRYDVVGTEGRIALDPAYEYETELEISVKIGEREEKHKTAKRDQFAPELLHFAECILEDKAPRPSGHEGLHDVRIIEAIREACRSGRSVPISTDGKSSRPDERLVKEKPGVSKPPMINVESGSI